MYVNVIVNSIHIICSCYLNPETKFTWALIVPVIVIFLANSCFLVMTAVIMWRHKMKEIDKTKIQNIK